jgi:sugar phosphate isomerase/epimerase
MPSAGARRIAACSWSLHPANPGELVERIRATGLSRVQLALNPLREAPATWGGAGEILRAAGITIVSGMVNTRGEDYSSLEAIRRTGGVVPDGTWEENWRDLQAAARLASGLGLRLVTFHAGFLPADPASPAFAKLVERIRRIADAFAAGGVGIALETGQETAATLAQFLGKLGRPTVGVNFDPANMILYDKGDPVGSLRELAPWVRQVHIKDATRTRVTGTWGREVPVGTGDVDWPAFFGVLRGMPPELDLAIEREAGENRIDEIIQARRLIEAGAP